MAYTQKAQTGAPGRQLGNLVARPIRSVNWAKAGRVTFYALALALVLASGPLNSQQIFRFHVSIFSRPPDGFSSVFFFSLGIFNDVDRRKRMWHATRARCRSALPCHAAREICGRGLKF